MRVDPWHELRIRVDGSPAVVPMARQLGIDGIAPGLANGGDRVPFPLNDRVDLAAQGPDILVYVQRCVVDASGGRRRGGGGEHAGISSNDVPGAASTHRRARDVEPIRIDVVLGHHDRLQNLNGQPSLEFFGGCDGVGGPAPATHVGLGDRNHEERGIGRLMWGIDERSGPPNAVAGQRPVRGVGVVGSVEKYQQRILLGRIVARGDKDVVFEHLASGRIRVLVADIVGSRDALPDRRDECEREKASEKLPSPMNRHRVLLLRSFSDFERISQSRGSWTGRWQKTYFAVPGPRLTAVAPETCPARSPFL